MLYTIQKVLPTYKVGSRDADASKKFLLKNEIMYHIICLIHKFLSKETKYFLKIPFYKLLCVFNQSFWFDIIEFVVYSS